MNFHQTTIGKVFLIAVASIVLAGISFADPVKTEKDGIEITVTASKEGSGKTRISSVLLNRTRFVIAAVIPNTHSGAFHYKLLDRNGGEILPDPEWANTYAQKSSKRYLNPRSSGSVQVDPGKETKFEFYLEDAYGDGLGNGIEMIVSWESFHPDSTVVTGVYKDSEGKPALIEEKYMFPESWDISVTLPLKEKAGEETGIGPKKEASFQPDPAAKPPPARAPDEASEHSKPNYWWLLLAIPAILIAVLVARLRKSQASDVAGQDKSGP